MSASLQAPQSLRPILHYVKIANENATRDPVVYYWCLFYAVQTGMTLDKASPDAIHYLSSLLSTLETVKKQQAGQEAITQEMVAQAHVENFALKLFEFASKNDLQSNFSKNVVKAFYTAGLLFDVLTVFGELDEELLEKRKYAKWKATYIHNCLRNGETPIPGPPGAQDDEGEFDLTVPQKPGHDTDESHPAFNDGTSGPSAGAAGGNTGQYGQYPAFPGAHASSPPTAPARVQPPPRNLPAAAGADAEAAAAAAAAAANAAGGAANDRGKSVAAVNAMGLKMDDFIEAQKHAKYAVSALLYEDARTAIENLEKALALLKKNK